MSALQDLTRFFIRTFLRERLHPSPDPEVQVRTLILPGPATPPRKVRRDADITVESVAGREVIHLVPKGGGSGDHLLYWHGGSWVTPMIGLQWGLVHELMTRSGAEIWVPHYPLAPEHSVDDSFELLRRLQGLVRERAASGRMVVAGDSAGGGMTVLQALLARDEGLAPADHLLLFSPGVDLHFDNPELLAMVADEPMMRLPPTVAAGRAWAGARALDDPYVSVTFADLSGLPPMTLFQGDRDFLLPDSRSFAAKVRAAGTPIDYVEVPGGFHVHIGATWTPEAARDLDHAAAVIRGDADALARTAAASS